MQITATELKNRLGRYLDAAEQEPVRIQKSGREKAVLMSYSHYQQLVKSQQTESKPVDQLM
ncbi:MAG: type II toxin-antitoxin system Phd/YefM family antitoxin [Pseudomonadales bacterium]|nr:type II toxin-antitoxin system Phd/YefM family antitoxin [Pseudomonadales bacterium]